MDLPQLIEALSDPSAYPEATGAVEVCQTHISAVFLTTEHAYKIKKPVNLGFLDFSTLEKRRHFCEEEVRLNRRLARSVYLGVVPVVNTPAGLRVESEGEPVEWAVKMVRLPAAATLQARVRRGEVTADAVEELARRVAAFHAGADANPHISEFGRFAVVAGNARENFEQALPLVGKTVSRGVYERLRTLTEQALACHRALIEGRALRGVPRDTHGDLHLDHVYLFPDRPPPDDVLIIDCIEFNERFRFADPVADMAFLVMDFAYHNRRDLGAAFRAAYFAAAGDPEGRALVPFYSAYRAAVRAKVEGFKLAEREIPSADQTAALVSARAHWLLALGEFEQPGAKPCLVLVAGLPGTGKSTLARGLKEQAGFSLIRSDVVRKELAGLSGGEEAWLRGHPGIYTQQWSDRTYAECLRRAEGLLWEGKRVVVDANFREEKRRKPFLEAARRWGVPGLFLLCEADPERIHERLRQREGDASDADWEIYLQARAAWEPPGPLTQQALRSISTNERPEDALRRALEVLRASAL